MFKIVNDDGLIGFCDHPRYVIDSDGIFIEADQDEEIAQPISEPQTPVPVNQPEEAQEQENENAEGTELQTDSSEEAAPLSAVRYREGIRLSVCSKMI